MEIIESLAELFKDFYLYKLGKKNVLISNLKIESTYLPNHKGFKKVNDKDLVKIWNTRRIKCRFNFLLDPCTYRLFKKNVKTISTRGKFFTAMDNKLGNQILICQDKNLFLLKIIQLNVQLKYNPDQIVAYLHGAAIDRNGAVLILGDKNTGKSSLCYYLREEGYQIIGDDKLVITTHDKKFFISSISNIIKLRKNVPVKENDAITIGMRKYLRIDGSNEEYEIKKLCILRRGRSEKTKLSTLKNFNELLKELEKHVYGFTKKMNPLESFFMDLSKKEKIKYLHINWREKEIIKKVKRLVTSI